MTKHKPAKHPWLNALGALGYISAGLQWMWSVMPLVIPTIMSDTFRDMFMPKPSTPSPASEPIMLPEWGQLIVMAIAVVFAISMVVYAFIAIPREIGKVGKRATVSATKAVVPIVTHHKKISKKKRRALVERITWSVKFAIIFVPVLLLAIPPHCSIHLPHSISMVFGLFLFAGSCLWFGIQFTAARLRHVSSQDIW